MFKGGPTLLVTLVPIEIVVIVVETEVELV